MGTFFFFRVSRFHKLLLQCCFCISDIFWTWQLQQEESSLSFPASGLGRESITITLKHNKIFALCPTPRACAVAQPNFHWRPHHRDCGWASRTIHKSNCFSFAKMNKIQKKDCKKRSIYLHTDCLFSLTHSVYSGEVDVCWIILYGWMLGFFCLFLL